jgi:hypothetical protein
MFGLMLEMNENMRQIKPNIENIFKSKSKMSMKLDHRDWLVRPTIDQVISVLEEMIAESS